MSERLLDDFAGKLGGIAGPLGAQRLARSRGGQDRELEASRGQCRVLAECGHEAGGVLQRQGGMVAARQRLLLWQQAIEVSTPRRRIRGFTGSQAARLGGCEDLLDSPAHAAGRIRLL